MISTFAAEQLVNEQPINVTLSIGISLYPNDGTDVNALFQHADTAMYRAKLRGRNNFMFYSNAVDLPDSTLEATNPQRPQAKTNS
jgi:diguanylate cyclase (GGDEF)-like protein